MDDAKSGRTGTDSDEDAAFVRVLVQSGRYADEEAVWSAGLQALREREASLDRMLREELAPAWEHLTDPARAMSLDDVFADVRRRRPDGRKPGA